MTGRWLDDLPAFRVHELPRPGPAGGADQARRHGRRQRTAALAAAYHGGGAVGLAWCRPAPGGPLHLFAAGDVTGSGTVLRLPAGGQASGPWPGGLAEALARIPLWTRVAAVTDGLLVGDGGGRHGDGRDGDDLDLPSLEESFVGVWRDPFAVLVVALPVPAGELSAMASEAAGAAREAKARSAGSADYAIRTERLERGLRELRRAESTGLWRVHVLAGGADPAAAGRVAALFAAAVDLAGLPYALVPVGEPGSLDTVLYAQQPSVAGSPLVAALMQPPRVEVPGVRLRLRPEFDVTPEIGGDKDSVRLGAVLDADGCPVGALSVPTESLVRHVFVAGATGAGKSQTVRALLEQADALDVPWLVVEPSKSEYRAMAARLPGRRVVTIRPGDVAAVPAGLNPLEPAPGFPLQTHVDLVKALFLAAFEADEPFPQVLGAALTRCYEDQGWHLALGRPRTGSRRPRYPTLGDLQRTAENVVADIGYGREVTDNVRGFIRVRLGSLRLGTTGRFFEGGHPIDLGRLLGNRVVFEIEDVGDDQDKAFLLGTVLIRLTEHLRVARRAGPVRLRHLAVFEEAHRLLRRQQGRGPAAHAVELFAGLLAEIRAYGEGIVVAEQIPSKLLPDVIKNTAVKVLHRLPARDDREAVGATMNLTEAQSSYLVTLPPGIAAAFVDGMDYPVLVSMPDGTAREAVPASPASPACLVDRRSSTCGPDCRREPCTLTQLETARQLISGRETGWLALWAEICVLAHLTGHASPVPGPSLAAAARSLPPRRRDCAIGQAVDAAVAARSAVVVRTAAPGELAAHVAGAMRDQLRGRSCPGEEPEWLSYPFRWCLVWDELMRAVRDRPTAPRHPRSAEWEARYARRIPGRDAAAQLSAVQDWYRADERDRAARAVVFFGAQRPSALERAVGTAAGSPDWALRLAESLALLPDASWAVRYLDRKEPQ